MRNAPVAASRTRKLRDKLSAVCWVRLRWNSSLRVGKPATKDGQAFILDEIRRTAAENSGQVLGRRGFLNETGIKASDWDKYWDRWGDAVRAAGFKPNNRNVAYREQGVFEKLIL